MSDLNKSASTSSKNASQRFGPYVVGDTIGRGTFAKVKIAVHETTKVRVALKVIPRKVLDNDSHSALKIKREIKVMTVLRHPHITRLYDVVQTKHDVVLVLEFVSGGELFDYISKKGRVDEATGRNLFQQICAAVAYCHRYRVTHRDIKPENIMLEHGSHNIKLSDFGLSSITHDGRFFETSCGTPNYASPEVVSGQLYGGPETDVWSCGVVLYAMLTGTLPFDDNNVSALFKKIQAADYPAPRHVSPEAADLIKCMLLVNPLERATMEQVMQHPWLRPQFPQYLLSLHYEAVLDTMRFAKDHTVSESMLDEEVVRVVASRFRLTPQQVVSIVTEEEEKVPSMWAVVTEDSSGHTSTRRYPAASYWENFSNVLDAKLWPMPLAITPAEVALRDETHDVVVSYHILTQKKQNKLGPEEYAKRSFGESATNLLQSQSQQGYGSLNANSLHQASANSSFTGSSFNASTAPLLQRHKADKKGGEKGLLELPEKGSSLPDDAYKSSSAAPGDHEDPWLEGYNYLSAPFMPLQHEQSQHTVVGGILGVNELSVKLMRARKLHVEPVVRSVHGDSGDSGLGGAPSLLRPVSTANNREDDYAPQTSHSTSLLHPLSSPNPKERAESANRSKEPSTGSAKGGTKAPASKPTTTATKPGKDAVERGTVLETLYSVEVATRFGNDFIRNGVLFHPTTPQTTLRATYEAMREEGLVWRVIYDYYFSCVRFPNVKLQVKIYKVNKEEQLVDVKVSVQTGMESYDAAVSLLDRLRAKAVNISNHGGMKPKKKNSLLAHFSAPIAPKGKVSTGNFSNAGKGSVTSVTSSASVASKKK